MLKKILVICLTTLVFFTSHAQEDDATMHFNYSYHQATGNRRIEGAGTFPNVEHQSFEIARNAAWLVGATYPPTVAWFIQDITGAIHSLVTNDSDTHAPLVYSPDTAPLGFLLATKISENTGQVLETNLDISPLTHPVALSNDLFAMVSLNGELLLQRGDTELDRLALNIQLDARLVLSDNGELAVYTGASNQRYVHGIMGDDLEASSLHIFRVINDKWEQIQRIDLNGDAVYEGLSPIWADVDGDGRQDLITTVSDSATGSRIRVYLLKADSLEVVDGPAIGQPNRWQHQLAFAPFGPNGEMELVEVKTPHIGGIVRFYRFTGERMEILAEITGYTSHVIGSRNLDMAVAGDFNGDGIPEIVLPSQDRTRIAGIQRNANGAFVAWELDAGGVITTNLSAVRLNDNRLLLAYGTDTGYVHVLR